MVDFSKFYTWKNLKILESGIFVLIAEEFCDYFVNSFHNHKFTLSIRNNDGELVKMGSIDDENSLKTILNVMDNGKLFSDNILQ